MSITAAPGKVVARLCGFQQCNTAQLEQGGRCREETLQVTVHLRGQALAEERSGSHISRLRDSVFSTCERQPQKQQCGLEI